MPHKLLVIIGLLIIIISLYIRLKEIERYKTIEEFGKTDISGNQNVSKKFSNKLDSVQISVIVFISIGTIIFMIGIYYWVKKSFNEEAGNETEYSSSNDNNDNNNNNNNNNDNDDNIDIEKKMKKEARKQEKKNKYLEWEVEYEKNKLEYEQRKKAKKESKTSKYNAPEAEKDEKIESQMSSMNKINSLFKNSNEQNEIKEIYKDFDKKIKDTGAKEMIILTSSIPVLQSINSFINKGFQEKYECNENIMGAPSYTPPPKQGQSSFIQSTDNTKPLTVSEKIERANETIKTRFREGLDRGKTNLQQSKLAKIISYPQPELQQGIPLTKETKPLEINQDTQQKTKEHILKLFKLI